MKTRLFILTALVILLVSCKKEDKPQPDLPKTPEVTTGNLSGKVAHYNQFGTLYTSGLNTTTVSIEGNGFTSVTDENGSYTLTNVPTNTYTLVFKKPGCGLIKKINVLYKFTDTVKYNASVADLPTFNLNSAYAKDTSWFGGTLPGIYYNAGATPQDENASIVAIVGKSQNMDLGDPTSYLNYANASLLKNLDFNRFLSYQLLKGTYTFKQDSILYMKIYPVSTKGASYFDIKLNTLVYTAYGAPYPTLFSLYVH